jgi:hypothetical protein
VYIDCDTGIEATAEDLAFYGARLVKPGESFSFENDVPLPVAHMRIGAGYVDGYIRHPQRGGGIYMEYHDRPHFHLPRERECGGYLMLGKVLHSDDPKYFDDSPELIKPHYTSQTFAVTGFKIPFGYAVFTGRNVLHNDRSLYFFCSLRLRASHRLAVTFLARTAWFILSLKTTAPVCCAGAWATARTSSGLQTGLLRLSFSMFRVWEFGCFE